MPTGGSSALPSRRAASRGTKVSGTTHGAESTASRATVIDEPGQRSGMMGNSF